MYSTPTRYIAAVHSLNLTWEVRTDDLFPYSIFPHGYLTGFYTSRPQFKGFVRHQNALLHAADQIVAGTGRAEALPALAVLRESFAVAQHHDAVSGTEREHVARDYAMRLANGTCAVSAALGLSKCVLLCFWSFFTACTLVLAKMTESLSAWQFCPLLNETICTAITGQNPLPFSTPIFLWNALSRDSTQAVTLPIPPGMGYAVLDARGHALPSQCK